MSSNPKTSGLRSHPSSLPPDVVLRVSGVSKKFCRNLRRSMWYGIQDLSKNLFGRMAEGGDLRPEERAEGGDLRPEDDSQTSGFKFHPSSLPDEFHPSSLAPSFRPHPSSLPTPPQVSGLTPHPSSPSPSPQVSGFIPHPSSLPSPLQVSGLTPHPSSPIPHPSSPIPHPSSDGLRRDEFWALRDISFDLRRGECLGLIGRNGCGKTTLLRLIAGIFPPDAGEIAIRGRVGALIALGAGFHPHMTGRENVYLNGAILGLSKKEIDAQIDEVVAFAEIDEFIDAPVSTYSSGMRVKLGFAVASHVACDLLLIDEVLAVGDMGFRYKCFRRIGELIANAAVIFVSHDMASVSRISTSVMLMEQGGILVQSEDKPLTIQRYLNQFSDKGMFSSGVGDVYISDERIHPINSVVLGSELSYGEPALVEFTVKFDSFTPKALIVVNILDQSNNAVAQFESQNHDFVIKNAMGSYKVCMNMHNIPLAPGKYSLWIIVSKGTTGSATVKYGVCPFTVTGSFVGYIPIQPMADWSATPC